MTAEHVRHRGRTHPGTRGDVFDRDPLHPAIFASSGSALIIDDKSVCTGSGAIGAVPADGQLSLTFNTSLPRVWPSSIARWASAAFSRSNTWSTNTFTSLDSSSREMIASVDPSGTTR